MKPDTPNALVYLDAAATSRGKPEAVYEAMDCFMRRVGASPGRSVHGPGIQAGRVVNETRDGVAALLGVTDSARIVFTLNCTEALNLAIRGTLATGAHVVTTSMEHNSVMRPLNALQTERDIVITRVRADGCGVVDPDDVAAAIQPDTALIVMTHASNVCGAIQPVEACARIAREHGIPILVDAAQSAGCVPIDLEATPVDLLAFSGHKGLMGPQGTGGLYVGKGLDVLPLKQGGTGSSSSKETQPDFLPDRYESGTPNTPGLAGLGAAVEFVRGAGVERIREKTMRMGQAIVDGMAALEGVSLYGPRDMRRNAGVFSFRIHGKDPADVAASLESRHRVLTRVGLQCAPSAHKTLGTFPCGTVRASIGYFTTEAEIAVFLKALEETVHG